MFVKEVKIPEGVSVSLEGRSTVKVEGPKGALRRSFNLLPSVRIEVSDGKVRVLSDVERRKVKALVGTVAAHVRNMIKGVTEGHTYRLKVCFAHFPMRVEVKGDRVLIHNFLGEKTPRVAKVVEGVEVKVEGQDVVVSGVDVEAVGTTASNIEQACRVVGYDRRRFPDGIYIYKKE